MRHLSAGEPAVVARRRFNGRDGTGRTRVKKSLLGLFGVAGLVSVLAASRCSSSGSSATLAEATASCNAYCDAYIAAACTDSLYTSADECKTTECAPETGSASCYAAVKAFYDCEKTQADICGDTGCTNQLGAAISACPQP
jgi:hypothetical protein